MKPRLNRHEFMVNAGRGGLLAGLLGIGAMALRGDKEVSECFNHNYCDSCWAFNGCTLPEKKDTPHE